MLPLWWVRTNFIFFPLLLNNDYCVFRYFIGIAALLRDQFLAICGVECSILFISNKLEQIKCFYINFNGKKCFLIWIFAIRTAKKNKLSSNQEVPLYICTKIYWLQDGGSFSLSLYGCLLCSQLRVMFILVHHLHDNNQLPIRLTETLTLINTLS